MRPFALSVFLSAWMAGPPGPIPDDSRQLIVVVTPGWTATSGTLYRFERESDGWRPIGPRVDVVVGRAGLGWGRGLHLPINTSPLKREGDGRAPAGVFALTEAFGYAPQDSVETRLPYLRATPDLECVDDVESAFYNQVVDRRRVDQDWTSHEEMRRRDVLYRRGVVVAHNASPAVPAGGSCIFLHVWRGPLSTTSGCTAMPEENLEEVIAWLDRESSPVLVQLPSAEYRRLARRWELPALPG